MIPILMDSLCGAVPNEVCASGLCARARPVPWGLWAQCRAQLPAPGQRWVRCAENLGVKESVGNVLSKSYILSVLLLRARTSPIAGVNTMCTALSRATSRSSIT